MRCYLRLVKVVLEFCLCGQVESAKKEGAEGNCVVKGTEVASRMTYWNCKRFHMSDRSGVGVWTLEGRG